MRPNVWKPLWLGALLALLLASLSAQPTAGAPPKASGAGKADSATSPTTSIAQNLSALFGSGFERLECEEFDSTPDGQINVKGRVYLKTVQLTLNCNTLTLNPQTKMMLALGTPVKIRQGDVNAECKRFLYDIDKKQSTLEQNPVVLQKAGDQVTRLVADQIILTQDPSGKTGVHLKMDEKNPKKLSVIEVLPTGEKKTGEQKKPEEPKKVNDEKGRMLIKMPGTE
jgi:hypothetical protein